MTLSSAELLQFVLGSFLIVLLPGPNSLFVATTAAKISPRAGWQAACGVFLSDAVLMVLAVLGAGTVLSGGSVFFRILTLCGGAYLGYLSWGLIRRGMELLRQHRALSQTEVATDSLNPIDPGESTISYEKTVSPFRRATVTGLLNPKAILFFAAFFVQFIKPGDPHLWVNFTTLAIIMQCVSCCYLATIITVSSRLGHRVSARPRVVAGAHVVAGLAFCLFGVKLVWMAF